MGKLTISTGPLSIAFCMFTRGYHFPPTVMNRRWLILTYSPKRSSFRLGIPHSQIWRFPRKGYPQIIYCNSWLVVYLPLCKILISWDHYSQLNGKIQNVPNHQPDRILNHQFFGIPIYGHLHITMWVKPLVPSKYTGYDLEGYLDARGMSA